jgi:hypothetical protein
VANDGQIRLFMNSKKGKQPIKMTDEVKEKISKSKLGTKMSLESSNKKRKKMLGKPKHTEESKKRIGLKNKHPKPDGFKEKLKKPKTKEHCKNISISHIGFSNWYNTLE